MPTLRRPRPQPHWLTAPHSRRPISSQTQPCHILPRRLVRPALKAPRSIMQAGSLSFDEQRYVPLPSVYCYCPVFMVPRVQTSAPLNGFPLFLLPPAQPAGGQRPVQDAVLLGQRDHLHAAAAAAARRVQLLPHQRGAPEPAGAALHDAGTHALRIPGDLSRAAPLVLGPWLFLPGRA